jgi:hypothetical protein
MLEGEGDGREYSQLTLWYVRQRYPFDISHVHVQHEPCMLSSHMRLRDWPIDRLRPAHPTIPCKHFCAMTRTLHPLLTAGLSGNVSLEVLTSN